MIRQQDVFGSSSACQGDVSVSGEMYGACGEVGVKEVWGDSLWGDVNVWQVYGWIWGELQ